MQTLKINFGDGIATLDPDDGHGPIATVKARRTYTHNVAEYTAYAKLFAHSHDLLSAAEEVLAAALPFSESDDKELVRAVRKLRQRVRSAGGNSFE